MKYLLRILININFIIVILRQAEGLCFQDGVSHNVGEQWPAHVGECFISTCWTNGVVFSIGCGSYYVNHSSGCWLLNPDLRLQFPACCPKLACDRPNEPPIPLMDGRGY